MPFFNWSRTASSNGTADPTAPFPEGMAPSAYNDSARGLMAGLADWRDDMAGAIVTTGTNSAYLVSSFSGFDTTTHLDGQVVAFSPHTGNVDTVTLSVDSLGAFPLRASPGVELVAGTLIQGTPYAALFNKTNGEFYLKGAGAGNPYNVPLLAGLEFWDTIAPNSRFIFPQGQAISRTVYATAFGRWGTTYGAGDGSTTFNVPDKRGRVSACYDPGNATGRLTAVVNGAALGSAGGEQIHTLAAAEIPSINSLNSNVPSYSLQSGTTTIGSGGINANAPNSTALNGSGSGLESFAVSGTVTLTAGTINSISNNTGGAAHNNVQPTIVCNSIIRIL